MNSKHLGKCQFALELIEFLTVSNFFPLEVALNANVVHYVKTQLTVGVKRLYILTKISATTNTRTPAI